MQKNYYITMLENSEDCTSSNMSGLNMENLS
jgi:hypothetical protein